MGSNIIFSLKSIMLVLIIVFYYCVDRTDQLRFNSIQIPSLVQRGTNFWLVCQFELDKSGGDQLYSVKWYKQDEEFYRLQLPALDNGIAPNRAQHQHQHHQQPQHQQQQYFSQPGVNVRMSLSNATHVLLLNTTLESEGLYACEISTQNLSTIRYEKEIRVYVLPQNRLNILGSKNRYSIGDNVRLVCSSDFSRPPPALSWFVNGERTESKPGDPSLFKLSLELAFKLTPDFLASSSDPNGFNQRNQSHSNNHIQSVGRAFLSPPNQQPYQLYRGLVSLQCKYRLTEVSDVSFNELVISSDQMDLTTNREEDSSSLANDARDEIRPSDDDEDRGEREGAARASDQSGVSARSTKSSSRPAVRRIAKSQSSSYSEYLADSVASLPAKAAASRFTRLRRAKRATSSASSSMVVVSKSAQENKVVQSKYPAKELEMRQQFEPKSIRQHIQNLQTHGKPDACSSGALALQPDDPVIVETSRIEEPANKPSAQVGDDEQRDTDRLQDVSRDIDIASDRSLQPSENVDEKRQLDMNAATAPQLSRGSIIGRHISVNCMTIGAIISFNDFRTNIKSEHQFRSADSDVNGQIGPTNRNEAQASNLLEAGESLEKFPLARGEISGLCNNDRVRHRQTISGIYRNELLMPIGGSDPLGAYTKTSASQQRSATQQNIRNVYLNLTPSIFDPNNKSNSDASGQLNQRHDFSQSKFTSPTYRPVSYGFETSTDEPQLLSTLANADSAAQASAGDSYITGAGTRNSLPASSSEWKNSKHHAADQLNPTILTPPLLEWFINNQEAPRSSAGLSSDALDYREYFANFDLRSVRQDLPISIALEKKHFMTPDSKVRLRCSSTQAQTLWLDSAELRIIATSSDQEHQSSGAKSNLWNRRKAGQNNPKQAQDKAPNMRAIHQARSNAPNLFSSSATVPISVLFGLIINLLIT